jgi:hypothetical protein
MHNTTLQYRTAGRRLFLPQAEVATSTVTSNFTFDLTTFSLEISTILPLPSTIHIIHAGLMLVVAVASHPVQLPSRQNG